MLIFFLIIILEGKKGKKGKKGKTIKIGKYFGKKYWDTISKKNNLTNLKERIWDTLL